MLGAVSTCCLSPYSDRRLVRSRRAAVDLHPYHSPAARVSLAAIFVCLQFLRTQKTRFASHKR